VDAAHIAQQETNVAEHSGPKSNGAEHFMPIIARTTSLRHSKHRAPGLVRPFMKARGAGAPGLARPFMTAAAGETSVNSEMDHSAPDVRTRLQHIAEPRPEKRR